MFITCIDSANSPAIPKQRSSPKPLLVLSVNGHLLNLPYPDAPPKMPLAPIADVRIYGVKVFVSTTHQPHTRRPFSARGPAASSTPTIQHGARLESSNFQFHGKANIPFFSLALTSSYIPFFKTTKMFRQALKKTPHDVVLLSAVRTPITRAFKGGFRDSYPEELLMPVLAAALTRANIPASAINDVLIGNVLTELGFAKTGRTALNAAGFPNSTTFHTVNRQCSSSLQAITHIAHSIAVGQISVGLEIGRAHV